MALGESSGPVILMASSPLLLDPTAAANAALSAAASSSAASLTSALGSGAATLVASLTGSGGLVASLASLATGTAVLSGVTQPGLTGAYGLTDVIMHCRNATSF